MDHSDAQFVTGLLIQSASSVHRAMKKLITALRWRRYLAERQRSELRNRERRKRNRRRTLNPFAGANRLHVPSNFSLVQNPNGSIEFLNKLTSLARIGAVLTDLENVQALTCDAVAGFVAYMRLNTGKHFPIGGNQPDDPRLVGILNDSGFFHHVRRNGPTVAAQRGRLIRLDKKDTAFQTGVAAELIDFANGQRRTPRGKDGPSYMTLLELMMNTIQHAAPDQTARQQWWATVFYDTERDVACYCFVDTGVGILKSRTMRQRLSHVRQAAFSSGTKLQKLLLREIPSKTGLPYRGRGLPSIYEASASGRISNLVIITNDAYANCAEGRYETLEHPFHGTFIYWET